MEALSQSQSPDQAKLRMIADDFRETIEWNAAAQVVNVMCSNIRREPPQRPWQDII